ncbi:MULTISPECIES: S49 family peptidase [unclassified Oceanobacter]|jgi:protease-4|uniref:S49 family peptidase n=1 Tax=unclassified Oceanobacter TaxID=2620260 RepID=UPI0026E4838B|nr:MULTISPECIES: S49 family peptidase [unclassified Oceanobacter]MDO6681038.1 S49 family peptidase [Oceanobacter sp. 5_MG-2023]MDP2504390.1 S49 family peptidase [Oceanobacter sp. 3_MG-2023]MDP2548286.1 S49 family peptidase [Oceanobacter sp. 4_MG-2023]MDP2608699.1 S49 family peptidase [Oceanobacter sp. 1_MG-2023]MDP2611795.1 S49 family peptidase [Oceanobacter sp. 2_MG-2023]
MNRPEDSSKEWKLISKLVMDLQKEQRRSRRWGIFFRVLMFSYLFVVLWMFRTPLEDAAAGGSAGGEPFAAVVEVTGAIAADKEASADALISGIRKAFEDQDALGLILRINSPGGSPVQAGYVYDEIKRLKETRPDFPVYAVIVDLGASGAYYIAAAADEIYADKASLVGSIGVVGSGFGFVDVMDKLGVERRSYTAGEHKGFLDPFLPERADEREFWEGVLAVTHKQFVEQVRNGRGDRLKETPDMFSGLIWSGEQALEMGLIDGLSSTSQLAREQLDTETLVNFTLRPNRFEELVGRLGASMGRGLSSVFVDQGITLR